MEKVGVEDSILQRLEGVPIKGYRVLVPIGAQEAFNIRGELSWHRQFLVKAMIETTFDEPVKRKELNV